MKIASCRSCGEPIIWTITEKGKRMPVDAEPVDVSAGAMLFRLVERSMDDEVLAQFVPAQFHAREPELFVSHFATCPHASQHRRTR